MGLAIRPLRLAGVPALAAYRGDITRAVVAGTILYYHGFGGSKADALEALTTLAEAGFLVLGLDNAGHGDRRLPDFDQRFATLGPGPELEAQFLTLVRATAQEVPGVIDELVARGLADPGHIGVAGWSMGGFVTYAAVTTDSRVRAAVAILGSPEWRLPWPESPHHFAGWFFPTALLSQTAGQDRRVPPHAVRQFHETLTPHYRAAPERLRHIEYPGIGHDVPAVIAADMRRLMAEWFQRFLP